MIEKIEFQDKTLICKDCSKEFVFTARDQEFFVSKHFHTPSRCKVCRIKRKNMNADSNLNLQRELYEITCAKCGEKHKIPFKPIEGRALFCKACYKSIK